MDSQIRSPRGSARAFEVAIEGMRGQVRSTGRGKEKSISAVVRISGQVRLEGGHEVWGIATSRTPARVLGVPTITSPVIRTTPRRTWITPLSRSTSDLRSSASSPYRSAHHAASSTSNPYLSGKFVTMASN